VAGGDRATATAGDAALSLVSWRLSRPAMPQPPCTPVHKAPPANVGGVLRGARQPPRRKKRGPEPGLAFSGTRVRRENGSRRLRHHQIEGLRARSAYRQRLTWRNRHRHGPATRRRPKGPPRPRTASGSLATSSAITAVIRRAQAWAGRPLQAVLQVPGPGAGNAGRSASAPLPIALRHLALRESRHRHACSCRRAAPIATKHIWSIPRKKNFLLS